MFRRIGLAFLVAVILITGLACGSRATPSPTPVMAETAEPTPAEASATSEEGWTFYDRSADGFELSLPSEWDEIELDAETTDGLMTAAADKYPQLAAVYEQMKNNSLDYKFFAFDLTPEAIAGNADTSVNVVTMLLPVDMSLDVYVQISVKESEKLNVASSPITHERMKTKWGELEKLRYSVSPGDVAPSGVTQFVGIKNKVAYILTMTTAKDQVEKYGPIFEKIGQSFDLINS